MQQGLQAARTPSSRLIGRSLAAQGVSPGLRFVRCCLDLAAHAQPPDAGVEGPSPRIVRFDRLGGHPLQLPARAALQATVCIAAESWTDA